MQGVHGGMQFVEAAVVDDHIVGECEPGVPRQLVAMIASAWARSTLSRAMVRSICTASGTSTTRMRSAR